MKQKELNELRELIAEYVENYPHKGKSDLAHLILDENDISLSHRSIRRYVALAKKEAALRDELIDDIEDNEAGKIFDIFANPYPTELSGGLKPSGSTSVHLGPTDATVTNEDEADDSVIEADNEMIEAKVPYDNGEVNPYTNGSMVALTYKGDELELPLETVDRVFCAYSRKGLNLTGPIVRSLLDISSEEFSAITSRMDLNKESKPYSSVIANILNEEDLQEYLAENTNYVLDLLYKHDGTVATELVRAYKAELVKLRNQDLYIKSLLKSIEKDLPDIKLVELKAKAPGESNIMHLIIPDMHIGLNQANYNNAIVQEKLEEVLGFLTGEERVHVTFMGDIIHSVSGMNHSNSWKNMLPDQTGANAIIKPFELLLNFLLAIRNLERVNVVGGNHDRLESNKSYENTAEGAKLIAYMLKRSLQTIPVVFSSSHVVDDDDPNMCMIYLHGDNPIDKESVQTLSWNFGNPDKFNYVLTAHMHSRKVEPKNDGLKYRKEQVMAFCPSDNYAKTLTAGSMPGFKMIACRDNKAPISFDISLSYD